MRYDRNIKTRSLYDYHRLRTMQWDAGLVGRCPMVQAREACECRYYWVNGWVDGFAVGGCERHETPDWSGAEHTACQIART